MSITTAYIIVIKRLIFLLLFLSFSINAKTFDEFQNHEESLENFLKHSSIIYGYALTAHNFSDLQQRCRIDMQHLIIDINQQKLWSLKGIKFNSKCF